MYPEEPRSGAKRYQFTIQLDNQKVYANRLINTSAEALANSLGLKYVFSDEIETATYSILSDICGDLSTEREARCRDQIKTYFFREIDKVFLSAYIDMPLL